jgi:hypothetical protein
LWDHLPVAELQTCEPCMGRYANITHASQKLAAQNRLAWLRENDPVRYFDGEWTECEDMLIDLAVNPLSTMRDRAAEVGDYTRSPDGTVPLPNIPAGCHVAQIVWDEERGEWVQRRIEVA